MTAYTIILTALVVLYIGYKIYRYINAKEDRHSRKQMTSRINTLEAEAQKLREVINAGIDKSNFDANDPNSPMSGGTEVQSLDEL